MIITKQTIEKILQYRNTSILLHGENTNYIQGLGKIDLLGKGDLLGKECILYDVPFNVTGDIYYISIIKKHKKNIITLLKEITKSPNYYNNIIRKKVIILFNLHELNTNYQQAIKTIIDISYLSCIFILHTNNLNFIDRNILGRLILFSLPKKIQIDETIDISYQKIIKLLKQNTFNSKVIEKKRELSYMFYMNHTHSVNLQKYLIEKIGSNAYIPNSVKYKLIEDMCRINKYYQHSYRKPIFLEFIIISLCKHLENYTYNL